MTGPLLYPGADHSTQWVGKGSVTMPMDHVKWVVHTTETAGGWPSYSYGGITMGSAPTLTYEPWQHKWRQHFEMNQSARALKNDGSFYCNRVDVVQTEISCYCDHALAAKYGHACTDLDAQAINDLGDFGAWLVKEWGMDLDFYPQALPWPKYPAGTTRMTTSRYAGFSGVLGHMAVPGNSHLDPGDLPMDKVKARMGGEKPPWPVRKDRGDAVQKMQELLRANGYGTGKDETGYFGGGTQLAIAKLQRAYEDTKGDPDGIIGPLTWAHILALKDKPQDPPPEGDWFDMATQADLEAAVTKALTTTKFPIDGPNGPTQQTLPTIIHNLEKQQDGDRELLVAIQAAIAALPQQKG